MSLPGLQLLAAARGSSDTGAFLNVTFRQCKHFHPDPSSGWVGKCHQHQACPSQWAEQTGHLAPAAPWQTHKANTATGTCAHGDAQGFPPASQGWGMPEGAWIWGGPAGTVCLGGTVPGQACGGNAGTLRTCLMLSLSEAPSTHQLTREPAFYTCNMYKRPQSCRESRTRAWSPLLRPPALRSPEAMWFVAAPGARATAFQRSPPQRPISHWLRSALAPSVLKAQLSQSVTGISQHSLGST